MKIKDIDVIIHTLEKIKMPSNPIVRHKLFSILSELKSEKSIQDDMKKSYITEDVIRIETGKYELIKSLHSDSGKIAVGEFKVDDVSPIEKYITLHNKHPDMVAFDSYNTYLLSEYFLKSELLNIDETSDEMFLNLSDEEISHLMSIIK